MYLFTSLFLIDIYVYRYILDFACNKAQAGMSTDDVDALAHAEMIRKGACPSPLNYYGFPKSICTSLNKVACHGRDRDDDT
jgi:methionyl aminopeptidase